VLDLLEQVRKREKNRYVGGTTGSKKKVRKIHKGSKKKVRKIHKGAQGGRYYITKGRKVYI
jgi:hypothetical protein